MKCRKYLIDSYLLLQTRNTYRYGHHRPVSTQIILEDIKPFESIPSLSSIPILGQLHHYLPVIGEIGPKGQLFAKFGDLHAKYGPIMKIDRIFQKGTFVILFEPKHFEQVFKAEETSPLRSGFETLAYYREHMRQSTFKEAHGLMTAQGAKWRNFRTKANPALLMPKLIKLYASDLEDIADDSVARISKLKDEKELLQENFELELKKWSLESVGLVGLGTRLGCLRDDLTEDHPARILLQTVRDAMDLTFKLEFKPSPWRYISTPNFKKIVKTFDTQWEISSAYIKEAKNKINSRGHDIAEEDKSVIEKLLAIDDQAAIMIANEMFLAGIDAVAFAIMSLLYHLAINQNVQDKLRQEIRSGNSNQYLRACLKEALRIWHVLPVISRRTSKEHIVGGYEIAKGVDILSPNEYLSNLEKYYPQPKEFLPERWLASKDDPIYHGNAHPLVNLPFGFGVRSCIGRRIAELKMEIFSKKLIDELKVSWEGPPLKVKSSFVNAMEKPFRIKFEVAK